MLTGCAIVDTRFDSSPIKAEYFPSTRLAAQYIQDRGEIIRSYGPSKEYIIGGTILLGYFSYSCVELFAAIVTDVLLVPLDAYAIWNEEQAREEFLKQCNDRTIEPGA